MSSLEKTSPNILVQAQDLMQDIQYINIGTALETLCPDNKVISPSARSGTMAIITLKNGMVITGKSFSANPDSFDETIGRHLAFADAMNQVVDLAVFQELNERRKEVN